MAKIEPGNAEVLLDGETVAGVLVKPWTLTKCAALSPVFEKIANDLKKRHLSFKDFFAEGKVINIEQLYFIIMPFMPEVLKITLDTDVDKLDQSTVLQFIVAIVRQNIEYLKNLFALIATMAQQLKEQTSSSGR
jgi:hypothetical protein